MSIRYRNGGFMIDNTLEIYATRLEAEEKLAEIKILTRAKRQGRRIRGKNVKQDMSIIRVWRNV